MLPPLSAWGPALVLALLAAGAAAPAARGCARAFGAPVAPVLLAAACALATGLAALAAPTQAGVAAVLGFVLTVLAAVDLAVLRLPDVLTLPLLAAGLLGALVTGSDATGRALGAGAGYLALAGVAWLYERRRGRPGLGLGDAKLFAAAGAWLGWEALPGVLLIACALGFASLALRVVRRGLGALGSPLPFGPALCAAFLIAYVQRRGGA